MCYVNQVPKRALSKMADVNEDAKRLRLSDERLSQFAQPAVGSVAAGKCIVRVPGQRRHAKALLPQPCKTVRVTADDLGALDGEKRSDFSFGNRPQNIVLRACEGNVLPVLCDLTAQDGERLIEQRFRVSTRACIAAKGKDLRVGVQRSRLFQRNVAGVAAQRLVPLPQLIGGVTVAVKKAYHEKASSR